MEYAIWNQTKNPIGIVQIIHDKKDRIYDCNNFANFLNKHRYLVYKCDMNTAPRFNNSPSNLPVFLIGIGRAGNIAQNTSKKFSDYSGVISLMAHTPISKRLSNTWLLRTGYKNPPKIPLLIIGGWDAIKQMQDHIERPTMDNCDLKNLSVLIYPGINQNNALNAAKDDIITFLNNSNQRV